VTDLAQLLRTASRTFAIGIERLPPGLREEVRTAYLLLRVSDYLEDNQEMAAPMKARLLGLWAEILEGSAKTSDLIAEVGPIRAKTPDAEVARRLEEVHGVFLTLAPAARSILRRHVADTSRGMARWALRGPDFADEADLDDYMHEVAGRVGHLLTDLFAERSRVVARQRSELSRLGQRFGLGLQTVNVIRGLHEDHDRDWVFVPRSFLPASCPDPSVLFREDQADAALEVLNRLVRKARGHLDDAERYITALPRSALGMRVFCALPLFFALRTLSLSRGNPEVLTHEVKMPRAEVVQLTARTRLLGWSNRWVRQTAAQLDPKDEPA